MKNKRYMTWEEKLDDGDSSYLVLDATKGDKRRHVHWSGYMWKFVIPSG